MADYRFEERAPYEEGFAEVYQAQIVPILKRYEETRGSLKARAIRGMGASGALGVGGVGAGYGFEEPTAAIFGGALGAFGAIGSRAYYGSKWKAGLGDEVLPILCDFLGDMRYGDQRIDAAKFEHLVPGYTQASFEDPVAGHHEGLDWALTEATLKSRRRDSKGRTRTTTVFRGLLFKIAVANPAPRIFFAKDRGSLANWLSESLSSSRRGLEKISVPDEDFERTYEIYTDDVEAALAYIGPDLIAALKHIAATETKDGRYLACAFNGPWFYIALPRKGDFLGMGSLFRPTHTLNEDLHQALSDLVLPRRVIHTLMHGP